jgi:prepilin-type N-terminal cleavage/methylation domain-containing protein
MKLQVPTPGNPRARSSHAFTIVELLVVISIVALLMSVILPSFKKARQQAERVACESNIRQAFMLLSNYATTNREYPVWDMNQPGAPEYDYGTNPATYNGRLNYYGGISPYWAMLADGENDWINNKVLKCGSKGVSGGNYNWNTVPAYTFSNRVPWDTTGMGANFNGQTTSLSNTTMQNSGWFIYTGPQTFANYSMWCMGNSPSRTLYTAFRYGAGDFYNQRFALAGDPLSAYGVSARYPTQTYRRAILTCPTIQRYTTGAWIEGREPHGDQIDQGNPNANWSGAFRVMDRNVAYEDGAIRSIVLNGAGMPPDL